MLFKNAHLFRLTRPLDMKPETFATALESTRFTPCTGTRPSSFGWVSPLDEAEAPLAHHVSGCVLLCAKREDKVVPTSALGDLLDGKVAQFESREGRPAGTRERQRLKEDALAELLPRALPRSKKIFGYISPQEDLLVIDTASTPEAEMFLSCLRATLGSLSVTPPQIRAKLTDVFTHWLKSRKLADDFSFGDQCELIDPEDGSSVSCRKQDLNSNEITVHLDAGKICTRLALIWHGDLQATLDKDLVLRQLKVRSTQEGMDDGNQDETSPAAQLDAAFVSTSLTLSRFLPALFTALGGETRD